jgi:hypothetical protein
MIGVIALSVATIVFILASLIIAWRKKPVDCPKDP